MSSKYFTVNYSKLLRNLAAHDFLVIQSENYNRLHLLQFCQL